jgi:NTE family protein
MEISLALGGGGVRGIAHIGVLRTFEREGYKIGAIAGTSAGGLVGALYAAGYTTGEMETIFTNVDQSKMFFRLPSEGPSLMGSAGLTKLLNECLGNKTFDNLHIPFVVTATDTSTGQEVLLHHGSVVQAVLATTAVPGVFSTRQIGSSTLFDGAVVDPVPVAAARWLKPDLPVIAVVLSKPSEKFTPPYGLPIPIPAPPALLETLSRFRLAQAFNLFIRSVEITSQAVTELRLEIDCPELIIRPDVSQYGLLDKVNASDLIKIGEKAANDALPQLKQVVSWPADVNRRLRSMFTPKKPPTWIQDL